MCFFPLWEKHLSSNKRLRISATKHRLAASFIAHFLFCCLAQRLASRLFLRLFLHQTNCPKYPDLMKGNRRLREKLAGAQKENLFLKKRRHSSQKESTRGISIHRRTSPSLPERYYIRMFIRQHPTHTELLHILHTDAANLLGQTSGSFFRLCQFPSAP